MADASGLLLEVAKSLQTHTPPDPVRRSTARSYDKGSRASRRLCWCTQRITLRHMRVTW